MGADGDVATLVQRLGAYRGHHVCSGAGQVAYFGPVELWTGRGLAFVARFDEAVEDLQTAVEVCSANGAVGYLAEAQYELASTLLRRRRPGDIGRARSLLTTSSRQATVLGMRVIVDKTNALVEELGAAGPAHPARVGRGRACRRRKDEPGDRPASCGCPSEPRRTTCNTSSPNLVCPTAAKSWPG